MDTFWGRLVYRLLLKVAKLLRGTHRSNSHVFSYVLRHTHGYFHKTRDKGVNYHDGALTNAKNFYSKNEAIQYRTLYLKGDPNWTVMVVFLADEA